MPKNSCESALNQNCFMQMLVFLCQSVTKWNGYKTGILI